MLYRDTLKREIDMVNQQVRLDRSTCIQYTDCKQGQYVLKVKKSLNYALLNL